VGHNVLDVEASRACSVEMFDFSRDSDGRVPAGLGEVHCPDDRRISLESHYSLHGFKLIAMIQLRGAPCPRSALQLEAWFPQEI